MFPAQTEADLFGACAQIVQQPSYVRVCVCVNSEAVVFTVH